MKKVYAVMVWGSSYPDAVFTTKAKAKAYCTEKRKINKQLSSQWQMDMDIYYRIYEYVLNEYK